MPQTKKKRRSPAPAQMKRRTTRSAASDRAAAWKRFEHFKPAEFTCKCDGLCDHSDVISLDLVENLERVREILGKPVIVTSGTRCERHNRRVGGRRGSAHVPRDGAGHAADILCPDPEYRFAFLTAALPLFRRIGIGRDFIHVDNDPHNTPNVMWIY